MLFPLPFSGLGYCHFKLVYHFHEELAQAWGATKKQFKLSALQVLNHFNRSIARTVYRRCVIVNFKKSIHMLVIHQQAVSHRPACQVNNPILTE